MNSNRNCIFVQRTPTLYYNKSFPYPGAHHRLYGQFMNRFNGYHPQRAGIIPYCYEDGHFYFFMSTSHFPSAVSSNVSFSSSLSLSEGESIIGDFGGGISKKESTTEGALRECLEESAGIFGFSYEDVHKKGFILYSEEIAIIFVPIQRSYMKTIKPLFQKYLEKYRDLLYNKQQELKTLIFEKSDFSKTEAFRSLLNEIEILQAMTEKTDIELVMDETLFYCLKTGCAYNGKRFYYLIANFLYRSRHILYRNLQRESDAFIPIHCVPYKKIIEIGVKTFSHRKHLLLQKRLTEYLAIAK